MVKPVSSISRIMLLLIPAILLPFVLTTLFVAALHGEGLHNAALHWTCVGAITCSGLPFVAIMPLSRVVRVTVALVALPILFVATIVWGAWIACTRFGSCP